VAAALLLASLGSAACASRTVVERPAGVPANADVAASLVVDQFLRAANSNDLDTMARLFGNQDGSVLLRDPKDSVDRQMFALASILRHDSYAIAGSQVVPGRRSEATQINVRMKFGTREVEVPWILVYSKDSIWLVEQIEITRITGGR
jgi:hypothetical protein